jgi:hypothetical protein
LRTTKSRVIRAKKERRDVADVRVDSMNKLLILQIYPGIG